MTSPKSRSETARDAMNQFCTVFNDFSVEIAMHTSMFPMTIRIMMQVMKKATRTIPSCVYPDPGYGTSSHQGREGDEGSVVGDKDELKDVEFKYKLVLKADSLMLLLYTSCCCSCSCKLTKSLTDSSCMKKSESPSVIIREDDDDVEEGVEVEVAFSSSRVSS